MKYALFKGNKIEAVKEAKGFCPICGSDVIAKCGDIKQHHWAHKGMRNCDPWWENETEWHRTWKNNFETDWQEKIIHDNKTGEKHIADVQTKHGLVIEFQHSHINNKECSKRESFYKNMVWVVDGTRLKRDYPRFLKGKENFRPTKERGLFTVDFPEECFPSAWIGKSVHVVFDFKGLETINDPQDWRNYLYYLFPEIGNRESVVAILTRESFINNIVEGKWFNHQQEQQERIEKQPIRKFQIPPQRQSPYILHRGRTIRRKRL